MDDKPLQAKIEEAQEHTRRAEKLVSAAEDEIEEIVAEEKNVNGDVSAFYSSEDGAFHVSITDEELVEQVNSHTDDDTMVHGGTMSLTISPSDPLVPNKTTGRDRLKSLKALIGRIEQKYDVGAPTNEVLAHSEAVGLNEAKAEKEIESLRKKGELYEPEQGYLRTT